VFPCFDEPALKATFDVALVAHNDHTCLSNMNVLLEEKLGDNKKLVKFARTLPMSTYVSDCSNLPKSRVLDRSAYSLP
jgi:aminopeptidase 2